MESPNKQVIGSFFCQDPILSHNNLKEKALKNDFINA